MRWIAPAGIDAAAETLEKLLWQATELRTNTALSTAQFSKPVDSGRRAQRLTFPTGWYLAMGELGRFLR